MEIISCILCFILVIKSASNQRNKYLIFKFRTNINLNEINEENYIPTALNQNIYIDFEIGDPPQTIPMTIKAWQYPTYVISNEVQDKIEVKYNPYKSKTYKNVTKSLISGLYKYDFTKGYLSNDIFNINSLSLNFNFMLAIENGMRSKNISGEIGLSRVNEHEENNIEEYSYIGDPPKTYFMKQLLDKKLIQNKIFGIIYDTEYEGRLIFGGYLHQVDNNYKPNEMIANYIDNDVIDNNRQKWMMKFEVKCISGEDNTIIYFDDSYGFFLYEMGLIIGSTHFMNTIIDGYFNNRGCNKTGQNLIQYYCSKEEQFEDFPNITLSYYGKYLFILTKNDLIKKIGNKYFFLIVFEQLINVEINYWRIGQPFFRKYSVFLKDGEKSYEMAYYLKKDITNNKDYKNQVNIQNVVIVILCCILIALITAIIIYFTKFYKKTRKKRIIELKDDEYEYNPNDIPKVGLLAEN